MKKFFCCFIAVTALFISTIDAQNIVPNTASESLKGAVKSVYTTIRSPKGHMVSQPISNTYDRNGNLLSVVYYDTTGNPVYSLNYSYDKKGLVTKSTGTLEPYGEVMSQTTYSYDTKQHTVTSETMGIVDSLNIKIVMQCDKDWRILNETSYDELDRIINLTKYEYNAAGKISYATNYEGEKGVYKGAEKYRYDTDGFLAEKCSYYLSTLRQAFLYTYYYDKTGNWTKGFLYHVTPTEGFLYQIISREITYFD